MNMPPHFYYHFYPVGQGLFATGTLLGSDPEIPRFQWVYDCGSRWSNTPVITSLESFRRWLQKRPVIDLLVISHFDTDHISGIVELLDRFQVQTLMLPYMPLPQRLAVAFAQEATDGSDLFNVLINPIAFFSAEGRGWKIREIVFVGPSGDDGPGDYPENAPEPGSNESGELQLTVPEGEPDDQDDYAAMKSAVPETTTIPAIKFLKAGAKLSAGRTWEFVPYNDSPPKPVNDAFTELVIEKRDKLHRSNYSRERGRLLDELKEAYDACFGSSGFARNVISLFLWSGPKQGGAALRSSWSESDDWCLWTNGEAPRAGILYTGDGYLNTPTRLSRIIGFFGGARLGAMGILQVMHHGSVKNWHSGVASSLDPLISVFCSEPTKGDKHPDGEVLRDFWGFNPVQVDERRDFTVSGYFTSV